MYMYDPANKIAEQQISDIVQHLPQPAAPKSIIYQPNINNKKNKSLW